MGIEAILVTIAISVIVSSIEFAAACARGPPDSYP
jgi:hypothetical protein